MIQTSIQTCNDLHYGLHSNLERGNAHVVDHTARKLHLYENIIVNTRETTNKTSSIFEVDAHDRMNHSWIGDLPDVPFLN